MCTDRVTVTTRTARPTSPATRRHMIVSTERHSSRCTHTSICNSGSCRGFQNHLRLAQPARPSPQQAQAGPSGDTSTSALFLLRSHGKAGFQIITKTGPPAGGAVPWVGLNELTFPGVGHRPWGTAHHGPTPCASGLQDRAEAAPAWGVSPENRGRGPASGPADPPPRPSRPAQACSLQTSSDRPPEAATTRLPSAQIWEGRDGGSQGRSGLLGGAHRAGPYPIQHVVVASGADGPRRIRGHVHLVRGIGRRSRRAPLAGGGMGGRGPSRGLTRMVLSVDVVYKAPSECLIPVI